MKLCKLIQDFRLAIKIMLQFSRQHSATLAMLEGTFIRQPLASERVAGLETTITIKALGSLFQIIRTAYISDRPEYNEKWLAVYAWHTNGHLIELGGDRHIVFNPDTKSMFLETLTDQAKFNVEMFTKNT